MSEYKYKIKHDLEHLNEYGLISGVYKLQQKLNELDEVYAKAAAFDEIQKSFYKIRKDMKDKNVGYVLGYQTVGTETAKYIKKYESGDSE